MNIVGIHNTGVLSSAALLSGGRLVFGAAEERFSRNKFDKYFPHRAIAAALAHAGLELADVDVFAIGWNPGVNIGERHRAGFSEWPAYPGERLYANPNHILPRLGPLDFTRTEQIFHERDGRRVVFDYVNHHLCHAANAYHLSGFDNAAILSVDGYGERSSTVLLWARAGQIEVLRTTDFPHSLGAFYSAITHHLGFRPDHDEYKVMGAAAFGDPARYRAAMQALVRLGDDGDYRLSLDHFDHFNFDSPGWFSPAGLALLGDPPRRHGEPILQRHHDLAAAAQERLEQSLRHVLAHLRARTGAADLCLTGGVAMNSLFNGRLSADGPFARVYVPFAPDDSGNSIGAALVAATARGEALDLRTPATPFLGPAFSDADIEAALRGFGLPSKRIDDVPAAVADCLVAGQVVGLFQGRMEFGQRALGARSILADPRRADMKDRLNAAVKYREGFRPFAPAVLAAEVPAWFAAPADHAVPYMEKVLAFRPERRAAVPAVVHADGTGRLQTLTPELHPDLHAVTAAFFARTGVPMVVNTSFNLNGEPIVCTPADAVRTFMTSGMDALFLGRFRLDKPART